MTWTEVSTFIRYLREQLAELNNFGRIGEGRVIPILYRASEVRRILTEANVPAGSVYARERDSIVPRFDAWVGNLSTSTTGRVGAILTAALAVVTQWLLVIEDFTVANPMVGQAPGADLELPIDSADKALEVLDRYKNFSGLVGDTENYNEFCNRFQEYFDLYHNPREGYPWLLIAASRDIDRQADRMILMLSQIEAKFVP
jgi:hypothetical protein